MLGDICGIVIMFYYVYWYLLFNVGGNGMAGGNDGNVYLNK